MFLDRWLDKETTPPTDNGTLFTAEKKWEVKLERDMEYTWIHITKWKKLIWKEYVFHESNCKTF